MIRCLRLAGSGSEAAADAKIQLLEKGRTLHCCLALQLCFPDQHRTAAGCHHRPDPLGKGQQGARLPVLGTAPEVCQAAALGGELLPQPLHQRLGAQEFQPLAPPAGLGAGIETHHAPMHRQG